MGLRKCLRDPSTVSMAACGHTLVVTEAGELWAWGERTQGQLGLNNGQGSHSAAMTAGGALCTWGRSEAKYTGSQVPGGI